MRVIIIIIIIIIITIIIIIIMIDVYTGKPLQCNEHWYQRGSCY